jgi:hypothetical protein
VVTLMIIPNGGSANPALLTVGQTFTVSSHDLH